jgi:hypothetical protein
MPNMQGQGPVTCLLPLSVMFRAGKIILSDYYGKIRSRNGATKESVMNGLQQKHAIQ